jgi:dihydrofolate reductase
MRKLKLQMQTSLNGIMTIEPEARNFKWDDEVRSFSIENLSKVDTIVLGRNTAEDFIPHWEKVSKDPGHDDYTFGKLLTDIPKVVFSEKMKSGKWTNATLVDGNIENEITKLKNTPGREIIVYGGISFVASLLKHRLIDELSLLVNPAVFGKGESIYASVKNNLQLTFERSKPFACGIVMLSYSPQNV